MHKSHGRTRSQASSTSSDSIIGIACAVGAATAIAGTCWLWWRKRQLCTLSDLRTPAYVIYLDVAKRNASQMIQRAKELGCTLRPHVKTHKTLEGATIQTGGSCRGIVVSTLQEASFFGAGGFDDVLYAVPITPDKLPDAARLSLRMSKFHIMIDNPIQLDHILRATPPSSSKPWSVVVMVDCGYHRDGVDPDDPASRELVRRICEAPSTDFSGIYTHGGHSYDCRTKEEIRAVSSAERDCVVRFSRLIREAGLSCKMVGIGSTPTCSHPPPDGLIGVNEMHPGNFFVYDYMQYKIGSCNLSDVASRVLTRVIGHYKASNMLLIDMGWTGCSAQGKELGYGAFEGHPELKIVALKQEAGEVTSAVEGRKLDFSKYPIGKILRLIPYHSCAAGAMHSKVHVVASSSPSDNADSEKVIDVWNSCRGWES